MYDLLMVLIALKACLAGLLAASVVILANTGSHRLAGLLISFPAILLTSVFVIGSTAGQKVAIDVVRANVIALPVWLVTVAAIWISLRHLPLAASLGVSLGVWLVAALVFVRVSG